MCDEEAYIYSGFDYGNYSNKFKNQLYIHRPLVEWPTKG